MLKPLKTAIKIAFFCLLMLAISVPCFAMRFSQPVKIGWSRYNGNMGGGHYIQDATIINASQYYNPYKKRYTGYDKGYATFDGGNLYLHFEGAHQWPVRVGASDKKNTVQAHVGGIYKINTDQGITLYFLTGDDEGVGFSLIGKRKDGRFVKYADGTAIYLSYFKNLCAFMNTLEVHDDSIIVDYNFGNFKIKLKWDEAAKWFSYERIS